MITRRNLMHLTTASLLAFAAFAGAARAADSYKPECFKPAASNEKMITAKNPHPAPTGLRWSTAMSPMPRASR